MIARREKSAKIQAGRQYRMEKVRKHSEKVKEKHLSIDIGLEVLLALREKGQSLSDVDIAFVCDVPRKTIHHIAYKALRKLRNNRRLGELNDN